ncbi:hypothetical protein [uncultured Trichococcus sp.]|uniref:hypothetical protein n=1 Tax=uncultured Trichococcus sp. TaxID=189665 RepID=UPI002A18E066|nr:hypothetical protein [uncultured Trichococcus sp.]
MANYKYSVKNTTTVQREKLRNIALSYSILDAAEPTNETMKLVDQYVDGKIEISDALEKTIERYRNLVVAHD